MTVRVRREVRSLCGSCNNAQVTTFKDGRVVTICHSHGMDVRRVSGEVVDCTSYEETGKMTQWDAEKIAWVLQVKPSGTIGFRPPKEQE